MVQNVLDIETIDKIVNSSSKIEGLDRNTLKRMILGSLFNDQKFMMADIEDGQMRAFLFATIEVLDGEDVCFIQACNSDKAGSVQIILDKLIAWCVGLGLKRMVFMTKRNPLAWERKYKFSRKYHVMERVI